MLKANRSSEKQKKRRRGGLGGRQDAEEGVAESLEEERGRGREARPKTGRGYC